MYSRLNFQIFDDMFVMFIFASSSVILRYGHDKKKEAFVS